MRYTATAILVVTLLVAASSASIADVVDDRELPIVGSELIGGAIWSKDLRITNNPEDDILPQVTADREHNAHIVWERSGMWTKTVDQMGTPGGKEVFITPHVVRGWGYRHPLGPTAAIDSMGSIHVTWDDGWQNVYYRKFDAHGNVLSDIIHVGNEDNTASHMPSIAVDPINDYVHIVHEDYQYQCEDIVYNKIIDGKLVVNAVAVSSDVSAHCEFSTLTTDAYGFIHVAFGTASGAMWRKVDQNGVARGISMNIFPAPLYVVPDMAVTPNGDVHFVWSWNEQVLYTRMDNNGTMLDEGVPVTTSDGVVGRPRIAAAHDSNTVYVVWTDFRDGNHEIYFAELAEHLQGTIPEAHRLTSNKARSDNPDVTVDPEDAVHVVWEDYRDGNAEVYYKTMYSITFEMALVDPCELGHMTFFHPNQTMVYAMYIENQGALEDGYDVTLALGEEALADGWTGGLDRTMFRDVSAGSRVFFNITLTSPSKASTGDFANVTLRATSRANPDVQRTLSWRSFVIVEKAVKVTCEEISKVVDPGDEVRYDLRVSNTGDVPDMYRVEHSLVPEDMGWEATLGTGTVLLDVGESVTVTVQLKVPVGARTDTSASVFVRVTSMTDPSVWGGKRLMAIVNPTFHIELDTPFPDKWVDPGGAVQFPVTIRNVGTVHGDVAVYLTSSETRPGWTAVLTAETMFLRGGEEHFFLLTVTAPSDALAGSRHAIRINAVSEDYSSSGGVEVTAIVNQVHRLSISLQANEVSLYAGEEARHLVTIHNDGNGNENVPLESTSVPPGWTVTFEREDNEIGSIVLLPKATSTVTVVVSTSFDSWAGRHFFRLVLHDGGGNEYSVSIGTNVHQRYALDLSASRYEGEAPPGGLETYGLMLSNDGNGDDTFSLEHQGLPSARWVAGFYEPSGKQVDRVTLGPGERRRIDLVVQVPDDTGHVGPVDLIASATSLGAHRDDVKLTLEVKRPDLRVQSVEYDPLHLPAGKRGQISVQVLNEGTFRADGVNVVLLENGREIGREGVSTIYPGGIVTVTFSWTPPAGKNTLTYLASCDVEEVDLDDNELTHQRTNAGGPEEDGIGVWVAISVLVAVLIGLLVLREHYVRRARME